MIMKKLLLSLSVVAYSMTICSQSGHGLGPQVNSLGLGHGIGAQSSSKGALHRETDASKPMFKEHNIVKNQFYEQNTIITKDSAYYAKIVKKHGWWIGIGKKMTLKEASHLNCYYKLSKKNKAGNWTYIEAFDGYGNLTTYHDIGTYLANQYDDEDKGLNSDWREKLQTVCKWEIVADASGNEVVQERALDSEGDVIYIYSPVKVGEREYTGSFTDSWGMPIFMRTDSLGNDAGYANFVHIIRDERGYEVLCSFTDRFGYPQKNKDGAYMTRREYDDKGNQIKEASLNIIGDNMIDDYGNCGWENTYKNNHRISSIYYNANWEPMLFPNLRNEGYKVYGFRFEPDEFGRDTAMVIIDAKGNPDVDREYGIHKIVYRYNNHGQQIYQAYYDINGYLIAGNKLGIAQMICDFTQEGFFKTIEYKGVDEQYVVGGNGFCKKVFAYDKEGVEISEIEYVTNSDRELIKSFEYSRDNSGNTVRIWYQKNKQRVDSVDAKGRNILLAWYDLDGNPIENEGLHKDIMEFDDDNNVETETWLDKDGNPYVDDDRGYSKDVTIRDNKNNTRTIFQWYGGLLKQAYQQKVNPNSKIPTQQWDVTPYGEHARVGWYDNLHYTCDVDYTMYGDIRTMVGRNEFDEPAYLTFLGTSGEVYHFSVPGKDHRLYYDEFGVEIPDSMMADFKSKLPKVFCIEVTDTTIAYPLGLRNGDVIISYGDWITEKDLNTNVNYFYLETILKANQDKQITLLRHHPETNSSEILHRNLPKGKTSDLGFYPHKIYYTQREKQRLLNTCDKYGEEFVPLVTVEDTTILLAVQTKGGFSATRLYHLSMYNIKDPGIVLYAKEEYNKGVDTWSMHNSVEQWARQDMFRIKGSNLYFTQDLETTRHINKQSYGLGGMTFIPIEVSKGVYETLLRCYESLGDSITNEKKSIPQLNPYAIKVKEKQLIGTWQTITKLNDDYVPVTLEFFKGGKVNFRVEAEMKDESMQMMLEITSVGGSWTLSNGCITFDFRAAVNDCEIAKFDMPGVNEEQKKAMEVLLRGQFESKKENLLNSFNMSKMLGSDVFVLKSVSSKEFVILDGETERTFVKQKKR